MENTTIAPEVTEEEAMRVYEVRSYRATEFRKKVAAGNARLAKAGVDARFEFAEEAFEKRGGYNSFLGIYSNPPIFEPWMRFTQVSPLRLTIGNFTFVASLVAEEAGYTVHTAPGQNLDGWTRPAVDDIHCDHCKLDRKRVNIYIVRNNETGELVQLGHSCIELYTGLSPKGLFALTYDQELAGITEDDFGAGYTQRDYATEVNTVLALAFAYADGGRSYSNTKVREWGGTPTADKVKSHIFVGAPKRANFGRDEEGYRKAAQEYQEMAAKALAFAADENLMAAIKASAEAVSADSDYGQNLRTILAGESGIVRDRNVGILASLVAVYAREAELAVKRAAAPQIAKGFLGERKERLRGLEITLRTVKVWEGDFGYTTFMVGTTADNHLVVWKASKEIDVNVGDKVILDATVKDHDTYKGDDQTIVTRGAITEIVKAGA